MDNQRLFSSKEKDITPTDHNAWMKSGPLNNTSYGTDDGNRSTNAANKTRHNEYNRRNSATTTVENGFSTIPLNFQPRLRPLMRSIQLVWLDQNIDDTKEYFRNSLTQLRNLNFALKCFTNSDKCMEYLKSMTKMKTFLIVSGLLGRQVVPLIHNMTQIDTIVVFCYNKNQNIPWAKQWSKIVDIHCSIKDVCETLIKVTQISDHDAIPMSFVSKWVPSEAATKDQNLDQLEPAYMYSLLFKEIILEIDHDVTKSLYDLVNYCRNKGISTVQLDRFQLEYYKNSPIHWYSQPIFLYDVLNTALRSLDMEVMIKFGFFIQNLHLQLVRLHEKQLANFKKKFEVYRGQGFTQQAFQRLLDNKGGLLSFNSFLSTSKNREVAMNFIKLSMLKNRDHIGVLLIMKINPSKISTANIPFALINDHSFLPEEEEILFTMNTVFRIKNITQRTLDNQFWEVQLTLTDDNDPQMAKLVEQLKKRINDTGWYRMGKLMLEVGDFDQAKKLYNQLLEKAITNDDRQHIYHQLGWAQYNRGKYKKAIASYEKALEINLKTVPEDHMLLVPTFNNIALAYDHMGNYSQALNYYNIVQKSMEKALPSHHPDWSTFYNNVGLVYYSMGNYPKASEFYEKSRRIREQVLIPTHRDLAVSYTNIGLVYITIGKYSKALEFYQKSRQIYERVLPPKHPEFAAIQSKIVQVYHSMGDYSKALELCENLETIAKTLPTADPNLAVIKDTVGQVFNSMGDYQKALEYYEKSLEIINKTLTPNNPSLSSSYSVIGGVYLDLGDYSRALEFYQKAYKIREKILSVDHPALAGINVSFASYYEKMGQYSESLKALRKAFEIQNKRFEENNLVFSSTYGRLGRVYRSLKEYKKSLDYFQRCLEIYRKGLSEKHPFLGLTYSNIGDIHRLMGNYQTALKFHQKALRIQENIKCNPLDCATTYVNLGETHREMKDYSTALSFYQKCLEIREAKLPGDHPDLAVIYHNMSKLYFTTEEYNVALKYVQQAIDIAQKKLPSDHSHLLEYRETFEKISKKCEM